MKAEAGSRKQEAREDANPARKVLQSEELMGGAREVVIRHHGEEYRLQVTRNGKLILIK
jgi:hemin uptake protein HemP